MLVDKVQGERRSGSCLVMKQKQWKVFGPEYHWNNFKLFQMIGSNNTDMNETNSNFHVTSSHE